MNTQNNIINAADNSQRVPKQMNYRNWIGMHERTIKRVHLNVLFHSVVCYLWWELKSVMENISCFLFTACWNGKQRLYFIQQTKIKISDGKGEIVRGLNSPVTNGHMAWEASTPIPSWRKNNYSCFLIDIYLTWV